MAENKSDKDIKNIDFEEQETADELEQDLKFQRKLNKFKKGRSAKEIKYNDKKN